MDASNVNFANSTIQLPDIHSAIEAGNNLLLEFAIGHAAHDAASGMSATTTLRLLRAPSAEHAAAKREAVT